MARASCCDHPCRRDGSVLVIGAPYEDGDADGAIDQGAVYVYY